MPKPSTIPSTAARAARELRGLMSSHEPPFTGRDLAKTLGVSQQSASRRMTGETPINLDELWTIAAWLKVPVTRLTGNPEPATP